MSTLIRTYDPKYGLRYLVTVSSLFALFLTVIAVVMLACEAVK